MATGKTNPPKGEKPAAPGDQLGDNGRRVNLASLLSTTAKLATFDTWIVGLSPLIVHAWSLKAKREMLGKQSKAVKAKGREQRNPEADFVDSLYQMPEDKFGRSAYGFPATGLKKAFLTAAHKDKGLARTSVLSSLWLDSNMVAVRTAHPGAICDLPLVRIYGSDPMMREDMVKIGAGLAKTANLAYRAQFSTWAINIRGRFNEAVMTDLALVFLINDSGLGNGIGEWRNEKSGVFGAFALATPEEEEAWNLYKNNEGPLPVPTQVLQLAAE